MMLRKLPLIMSAMSIMAMKMSRYASQDASGQASWACTALCTEKWWKSSASVVLICWVDTFNLARPADKYLATPWTRLLPEEIYFASREDSFPNENDGVQVTFPHRLDTVVTGSTWSGSVAIGDAVRLLPLDREVRVRSIEVHAQAADRAVPVR